MHLRTVAVRDGMFRAQVYEGGAPGAAPLVFLHGSNGLMLDPYLDRLAERYRVIAPVHPGWGESTGLEHIDDIIDLAIYNYDLMDQLGIESAHVVGFSLGGMLAAEMAALDPGRVRRLVLCDAIGLWRDDAPVLDFFSADNATVQAAVWFDPQSEMVQLRMPDRNNLEALASAMFTQMQSLSAAAKFQWPIPDKGLKKRIHRISAPTLIIWGERDGLVPPVYAEEFRARIRNSRVEIMPNAAHMIMVEQEAEWVRLVSEFLG